MADQPVGGVYGRVGHRCVAQHDALCFLMRQSKSLKALQAKEAAAATAEASDRLDLVFAIVAICCDRCDLAFLVVIEAILCFGLSRSCVCDRCDLEFVIVAIGFVHVRLMIFQPTTASDGTSIARTRLWYR